MSPQPKLLAQATHVEVQSETPPDAGSIPAASTNFSRYNVTLENAGILPGHLWGTFRGTVDTQGFPVETQLQ